MLAQLVAHHPRGPGRPGLGTEGSDRQPVAQNTSTTLPILLLPWLTSAWDLRPAGRQSRAQLRTPDPQRRPATVSPSGCLRWLQATSAPTGGLGAPIQRRRRRRARAVEYLRACASAEVRIVGTGPQRIAQERQPFSGESAPAAQPRCASERSAAACRKGGVSAQHHSRPSFSSSVPWPLPPSNWCCLAATSTRPHHLLALRGLFPYRDSRRRLST